MEVNVHFLAVLYHTRTLARSPLLHFWPLDDVDVLNFSPSLAGILAPSLPSILMSIAMVERAVGGSRARKLRAVLPARALKGEKVACTAVMYFVSISEAVRTTNS